MRALAIGHSHSAALAEAAVAAAAPLDVINFWQHPGAVTQHAAEAVLSPALRERLGEAGVVVSLVGGGVHLDIGLVSHPEPFDVIDPEDPAAPRVPGARLIPYAAVRAALGAGAAPYQRIMDAVRAAAGGAMLHLAPPPVCAEDELAAADIPYWTAMFSAPPRIAPAPFRRKLWRLHCAVIAEHCAAIGANFLPCPPEALNAAGYLRPEFAGSAGHANAAYGALQLAQIAGFLPPAIPSGTRGLDYAAPGEPAAPDAASVKVPSP